MPRLTETMLDSGDRFPHLVFKKVGGGMDRSLHWRCVSNPR